MAIIFDGKEFAGNVEARLKLEIAKFSKKPKLVSIYNPQDLSSVTYSKIKAAMALQLGVTFVQYDISSTTDPEGLVTILNKDPNLNGLMIQMPLSEDRSHDAKLCQLITPAKDVDGLNPVSGMAPATVRGVLAILDKAIQTIPPRNVVKVVVVGGAGMVGRSLVRWLGKDKRFFVNGMDLDDFNHLVIPGADVVISATGQAGLIKPEMVKDGVIAIDVGFPHGDFDPLVAKKAAFFTPVPGGVGPVTVAMLFLNLVDLVSGIGS